MKLNKILLLLIIISIIISCGKNNINKASVITEIKKENVGLSITTLIGRWDFIDLIDKDGNVVKEIKYKSGSKQIISRPYLNFKKDETYESKYPHGNLETGKWDIIQEENKIICFLYTDSTTYIGKDLIKKEIAKKYNDGNYYEVLYKEVISLSDNNLTLFEAPSNKLIYKRIKE